MGDANGVGPEIVVRAAAAGLIPSDCVVYGDVDVLELAASKVGVYVRFGTEGLRVQDCGVLKASDVSPGTIDEGVGAAAVEYVERASRDALSGDLSAFVTLPINKEASRLSRPGFSGHTELIAEICGAASVTMMLASERLLVTHVSTHLALSAAIERVRTPRIIEVIRLTDQAVKRLRPSSRIAVAGLNPHAGEHGAFGSEDEEQIRPAVLQAREEGIDVRGPEAADTVFFNAIHRKRYDAVVCMYHDQGHIPMKTMDFDGGVNVTLGLPIVRTSVDHGTAYDIAYRGVARTRSFELALAMARRLAG